MIVEIRISLRRFNLRANRIFFKKLIREINVILFTLYNIFVDKIYKFIDTECFYADFFVTLKSILKNLMKEINIIKSS
jgi:hypothetical protein